MAAITTRELTDKQALFAEHFAEFGNRADSVLFAGYSTEFPERTATGLLRHPGIIAAIQSRLRMQFAADAPVARGVVLELATNDKVSPKVRLDAAKTLLGIAGHVAPRAILDKTQGDAPLHEMTTEDLRQLAARLENEIAGRAKEISSAVVAPASAQVSDLLG